MTRLVSSGCSNKADGDTRDEPPINLDNCLNCGQELLFVCSNENETSIRPGVVAFETFSKNEKTKVFMKEALKDVYSVLNAVDLEKDVENCALCVDCSLVFAQLFGLFQTFESRRQCASVLDVAVTKGIRWATEFPKNKRRSYVLHVFFETLIEMELLQVIRICLLFRRTEPKMERHVKADVVTESGNFASRLSDENNSASMDVDSELNDEAADMITVQSVPTPSDVAMDDSQSADDMNDGKFFHIFLQAFEYHSTEINGCFMNRKLDIGLG